MPDGDGRNPAQFSDSIIAFLHDHLPTVATPGEVIVFDPFAGAGLKLGVLCDHLGYAFVGNDLERWVERDGRVRTADSTLARNYPRAPHIVVTSPTYNNGVNDHFEPRESDTSRRLTYRTALGHALHPHNTGRYSGRGSQAQEQEYWRLTEACVVHWPDVVVVNVKDSTRAGSVYPLGAKWIALLKKYGYEVSTDKVGVDGWRYGTNHDKRTEWEWVLTGVKA